MKKYQVKNLIFLIILHRGLMKKSLLNGGLICLTIFRIGAESGWAKSNTPTAADLVPPDSGFLQILNLTDGSVYMGIITVTTYNNVLFRTDYGDLTIPIYQIESMETVSKERIIYGRYWFPNPNSTRLFFAPTGKMLGKGEGYFSDYYIFFPGVSYGLTDNIILGGGCSLLPGASLNKQIFYFTPKIGIESVKSFDLAAGALLIKFPEVDTEEDTSDESSSEMPSVVGILFSVATFGDADRSLTIGAGYGFVGSQLAEKPMFMIGGESRISRRIALVSENWILPGLDEPIISYGVRFFSQKLAIDLAFINLLGPHSIFPGIPYIDFVVQF